MGDVDGDGDLDVVTWRNGTGEGLLVRGDGAGTFGSAELLDLGGWPRQIALMDVDGDGDLDLLSADRGDYTNTVSTVTCCRNAGRGTFGPPSVVATLPSVSDLKLADLDGDGDSDLVVATGASLSGNTVNVYRNDGQGAFSSYGQVPVGHSIELLVLADVTGDNRPDLIMGENGVIQTALNDGSGNFPIVTEISLGTGYALGLGVEDYNGDGALDITGVAYGLSTGRPLLLLNRLPAPIITSFTPAFGPAGTSVTVTGQYLSNVLSADLNGLAVSNLQVQSPTSFTSTVPVGATTGYIHLNTDHGSADSPSPFTVTSGPPDLNVIGPLDVTGTYHNVTIYQYFGTVANLVGPLTVTGTLTVRGGGTLRTNCQPITGPGSFVMQPGAQLSICDPAGISRSGPTGAIQLTGSRTFAAGYYTYNGTQAQVTGTGLPAQTDSLALDNPAGLTLTQPLALTSLLRLTRGDLTTSGQRLTLLSAFNQQAWVDNTGGAVLGDATVQRFVAAFRNPGLGYRHFSAPIATATVGSLATAGFTPVVNPAYNTSSTPGQVTPFPTVYGYDQARSSTTAGNFSDFDKGWVSPASLGAPLTPGLGYSVNLSGGRTVAFTGPLNNGPLALPLARAATPVADGGWQLLGNPYPSPLDWSRVILPAGSEPALYYFQSTSAYGGSYARYVNGIGNPVLDVGQGFFVRVAQPDTVVSLTLTNAARRVDANPAVFQRTAADTRPQLSVRLANAAGLADETIVYFEAGATAGFDPAFDARQVAAPTGGEPAVWAVASGGEALGICGLPPVGAAGARVLLGVALPRAGTFTFSAPRPLNLAGQVVWLDDAVTEGTTRLDGGGTYTFSASAGALAGRFALRVGPAAPLATAATTLAAGVSVYPNPARASLTVWVPAVAGTSAFRIELLNALGQRVAQAQGPLPAAGGHLVLPLTGQAAGLYIVRVHLGAECVSKRVVVE